MQKKPWWHMSRVRLTPQCVAGVIAGTGLGLMIGSAVATGGMASGFYRRRYFICGWCDDGSRRPAEINPHQRTNRTVPENQTMELGPKELVAIALAIAVTVAVIYAVIYAFGLPRRK